MSKPPRVVPAKLHHRQAVEVLWVNAGEDVFVISLAPTYGGLMTHYVSKPRYCSGDKTCYPQWHKQPLQWRGYFPALNWDCSTGLWLPVVFELTEHAELACRGNFARGQLWRFSKGEDEGKKKARCEAELLELRPEEQLIEFFDAKPTLRRKFNAPSLSLGVSNPMPLKTVLEPLDASPPPGFSRKRALPAPDGSNRPRLSQGNRSEQEATNGHPAR